MHIYLDEDSIDQVLVQLLQRASHDVQIPADAGLSGKDDPTQLAHAITTGRVCLTGNHGDFMSLHQLLKAGSGHHPGIIVVRKESPPAGQMGTLCFTYATGQGIITPTCLFESNLDALHYRPDLNCYPPIRWHLHEERNHATNLA